MKAFLFDLINKLQRTSNTLDAKAILCNKTWRVFSDTDEKEVYIFMEDGKLVISVNGVAVIGNWMYIPANHSLVISGNNQNFLVHPIICNNVLALALDGSNQCCFLLDSTKDELENINSLKGIESYINKYANKMPLLSGTGATSRRNVVIQKPIPSGAIYATDPRLKIYEEDVWTDETHKYFHIYERLYIKRFLTYEKFTGTVYSSRHHIVKEYIDSRLWRDSIYYSNKQLAMESAYDINDEAKYYHYYDENGYELSYDDWCKQTEGLFISDESEFDNIPFGGPKLNMIDSVIVKIGSKFID